MIVGSAAILEDKKSVYAFGVKEPATHETYLFKFNKKHLLNGKVSGLKWWVENRWKTKIQEEPKSASLFISQTEFSVHYDENLAKFIQVQTYGFGKASIGYRLAERLQGPWSDPIMVFTPNIKDEQEFVYTANAHPEFKTDGLIITYNINSFKFEELIKNEEVYFPKIIKLRIKE